MDVVYERCCGLDVHKRTVVACLLTPGPQGRSQKAVRTFGTMTADVLAMAEWLAAHEATHVAMESTGQYAEALHVFEEARRLGREYRLDTLLARAISMSAGVHLEIFNFARAESLAQEARDLARSSNFQPPAVSAGIDLLLTYARQGEAGRADSLIDEVASVAEQTSGFHGWLWRIRLAEARAELALARSVPEDAIHWAGEAIAQSRERGRVKYQVLGLTTRAQALIDLQRTKDAIADLRAAVALARPTADLALFLRAATGLIAIDGDDALADEAQEVMARIAANLPDPDMRLQFERAEPSRLMSKPR
jgi:tetratricopeptide (TPR) repeat protein